MIDVSELMTDPDFVQQWPVTVLRGMGNYDGTGLYEPVAVAPIDVVMVIQQSTKKDLEALPEGERNGDFINWWLNPELIMADGVHMNLSDVILWRDKHYRIVRLADRSDNGFYTGIAQWAPIAAGLWEVGPPEPGEDYFSVSGTVSEEAMRFARALGVAGVAIVLQGPKTATVFTNAAGEYIFTNVPPGTYSITPTLVGFTFQPPMIQLSIP